MADVADAADSATSRGLCGRDTFFGLAGFGSPTCGVQHEGIEEHLPAYPEDLEDLAGKGYLRFQEQKPGIWKFNLTPEGLEYGKKLKHARDSEERLTEPSGHPLDWETRVLPVLEAVSRGYSRELAPGLGVQYGTIVQELGLKADEERTFAMGMVLDELVQTGYLQATITSDIHAGPEFCKLTERGLAITAGWPSSSGEAAFDRLLAVIDERLAEATTEEERTKWERLRDGVTDIGRDVVTGVLTTAANAAAKGWVT